MQIASGLLEKRVDMLEQVERLSGVALDSQSIEKVPSLMPKMEEARKDLEYILEQVLK